MVNPYKYKARPTPVAGHHKIGLQQDTIVYDSQLEARLAVLLLKHNVPFTPHVKFICFDRRGKEFSYAVDFLLRRPRKLVGLSYAMDALETKGIITKHDILRNEALNYCHGKRCYIVTRDLLELWEREGLDWRPEDFGGAL